MNTIKRSILGILIVALALTSVGMAAAQEPAPPETEEGQRGPRGDRDGRHGVDILEIVAEALELEEEDLREALREEGATMNSVIEANDGDIEEIQALVVEAIMAERPDAEEVAERIAERFDTEKGPREGRRGGPRGNNGPDGPPEDEEAPADDA